MPTLTTAELEARKGYLGGTDMAALAGLNPPGWAQPIDVWLEKTGQGKPRPTTPKMALGHLMEDTVCQLFAAATGYTVRRAPLIDAKRPELGTRLLRDPRRSYLAGHVDRYVRILDPRDPALPTSAILEAKQSDQPDDWGPQGSDQVPPHYRVQLLTYVAIRRQTGGFLAVLLPHADFRWYWIPLDYDTRDMLLALADSFWHDNVLAGVPPAPDGSDSYSEWLRSRWQADGSEAPATPEQAMWVDDLLAQDAAIKAAQAAREALAQRLMDSMGTTTRLLLPNGKRVNWSSFPTRSVRWKDLSRALVADALAHGRKADLATLTDDEIDKALADVAKPYTTVTQQRPLKLPKAKEAPDGE